MSHSAFRYSVVGALLALSGQASAVGLGELRGAPALGESPSLEIPLLGNDRAALDPACFRLKQPAGDSNLPWLKQATLTVRKGTPPVLQIRSHLPLSDPAFVIAVDVGCGYDVSREYVVLASPPSGKALISAGNAPLVQAPASAPASSGGSPPVRATAPKQPAAMAPSDLSAAAPKPQAEPAKAAAPGIQGDPAAASADKIKSMESQVVALEQRAADLAQKIEQTAASPTPDAKPAAEAPKAVSEPAPRSLPVRPESGGSNWTWFSALIGALLVVAAWLGWRSYRARQAGAEARGPDIMVDPKRIGEREERGGVDLDVAPEAMAMPVKLDVTAGGTVAPPSATAPPSRGDSLMSIAAASVDEHFEANPVMELAEIMLSFGRVKGAAQALQEYIDGNPQEALKPWIRLMDVYRMAGMRHEFEKIAHELNKNFNVQVQKWDDKGDSAIQGPVDVVLDCMPAAPAANPVDGLEGMPALLERIMVQWPSAEATGYLNQLLRDNRGGTRIGFPLNVVSDILFLIDLKEVATRIESESAPS